MNTRIQELESAARLAMAGNWRDTEPLPPGPSYSPFGYFRLAILVFALMVSVLFLLAIF